MGGGGALTGVVVVVVAAVDVDGGDDIDVVDGCGVAECFLRRSE
mgnify:CR=1 FL=1